MGRYWLVGSMILAGVLAGTVDATVYEWTDEHGVVSLTDDPDKIPPRYRTKVRKREIETQGAESSPLPKGESSISPEAPAPAAQTLYNGHDVAWWRAQFKALRDEQKRISDALPAKREQLTDIHRKRTIFQRPRDRVAYNNLNEEIQQDEARLKELQASMDRLAAEADRFGVPREGR